VDKITTVKYENKIQMDKTTPLKQNHNSYRQNNTSQLCN